MKKLFMNIKKRIIPASLVASLGAVPLSANAETVKVKDNLDATTVVGNILDYLLTAGQLVGAGVLIYAFISFALSISQENPDQRSRAIMFIVAGAMLVSIRPILKAIGVIA